MPPNNGCVMSLMEHPRRNADLDWEIVADAAWGKDGTVFTTTALGDIQVSSETITKLIRQFELSGRETITMKKFPNHKIYLAYLVTAATEAPFGEPQLTQLSPRLATNNEAARDAFAIEASALGYDPDNDELVVVTVGT